VNRELWRAHGTAHTTTPWRRQLTLGAWASTNAVVVPEIQRPAASATFPEVEPRRSSSTDPATITLAPVRPRADHDLSLVADPLRPR
jgi:hypothetical protein